MMSDTPENPYAGRSHEEPTTGPEDLHAIAALVGSTSSSLKDIDSKVVGGQTSFTQALKMNPTEVVKSIVGSPQSCSPQHSPPLPIPPPEDRHEPRSSVANAPPSMGNIGDLENRVEKIERALANYNKSFKFKRGISYDISTASIKGNFKKPEDIIDIILSELAKNAKSITIKLNDANKNRK